MTENRWWRWYETCWSISSHPQNDPKCFLWSFEMTINDNLDSPVWRHFENSTGHFIIAQNNSKWYISHGTFELSEISYFDNVKIAEIGQNSRNDPKWYCQFQNVYCTFPKQKPGEVLWRRQLLSIDFSQCKSIYQAHLPFWVKSFDTIDNIYNNVKYKKQIETLYSLVIHEFLTEETILVMYNLHLENWRSALYNKNYAQFYEPTFSYQLNASKCNPI